MLVTGDGSQERDFIHVRDLASANYKASVFPKRINTSFNIGFGSTTSILSLAKMIDNKFEFIDKREGEADITFADNLKARNILEWKPTIALEAYLDEIKK